MNGEVTNDRRDNSTLQLISTQYLDAFAFQNHLKLDFHHVKTLLT